MLKNYSHITMESRELPSVYVPAKCDMPPCWLQLWQLQTLSILHRILRNLFSFWEEPGNVSRKTKKVVHILCDNSLSVSSLHEGEKGLLLLIRQA